MGNTVTAKITPSPVAPWEIQPSAVAPWDNPVSPETTPTTPRGSTTCGHGIMTSQTAADDSVSL